MMKRIAVIFGGVSSEYEVSLQSASAVLAHLDKEQWEAIAIGITQKGEWYQYLGTLKGIQEDRWWQQKENLIPALLSTDRQVHGLLLFQNQRIETLWLDAVFPVLHGKNGEDGTLQGLVELAGIPLIGCQTLASALCMDKARAHQLAAASGIETARSIVLSCKKEIPIVKAQLLQLKFPLFVKPVRSGSSFGISRISHEDQLEEALYVAFEHDREVIVEEAINGFEVGCAIMEDQGELIAGEVDEIELTQGFFDYTEKYHLISSSIHCPARLPETERKRIQETAKQLFRLLDCRGFARVDLFYTPEGKIVFNEINTIPGFTAHSRFPSMMRAIGFSLEAVLTHLIREGLR